MESLTILLLLTIIVLLLRHSNRMESELRFLAQRLQQLSDRFAPGGRPVEEPAPLPQAGRPPQPRPVRPAPPRPSWTPPTPVGPPAMEPHVEKQKEPAPVAGSTSPMPRSMPTPVPPAPGSRLDRFFREHPDLEKFIGENLVNKIGIAILVLGIAFFVKYAIDQDWINEAGRVAIGIGCGTALIGLAHYLRRSYKAFSAVLAGGGIAVLYTTIAFAFHQYGLFSQTAAFVLMVVITLFAVLLALLYDSLALAVIATVGGFATPFLVSNGSGNYTVLFSYLGILNAGILVLAFFRRWPLLQTLAFAFTVIITGGWIATHSDAPGAVQHGRAFALVSLQYGLFLGSILAFPVRFGRAFRAYDLALLLLLTAAYYAAGMILLGHIDGGRYQGLFTVGSGAVDLALAVYCFRHKDTDRNLLYVLIGLALSFLTLAVPVQLHGHTITLFWSAEFVLLLWLFQRSGIALFRWGSWLLMALATVSLLMDWAFCPPTAGGLFVLFHNVAGGVTNAVAIAAFAAYYWLLQRGGTEAVEPKVTHRVLGWVAGTAAIGIAYGSLLSAVNLYFYNMPVVAVPNVYHRVITAAFALVLGWNAQRRGRSWAGAGQLVLAAVAGLYYLLSQEAIAALRAGIAAGRYSWGHFGMHAVATVLYITLLVRCALLVARDATLAPLRRGLAWCLSVAAVVFLSLDAGHYYALSGRGAAMELREQQYLRAGLTIVWALCSFGLMWLGMRRRARDLRIIALSLFGVTLLKLFFFDLRGISEGGKILAFILLGALLLSISFMYQKLKKLLIDDEKTV
ncbi:DUF2339 domain-containing protein [Flaviaesturariibacter terrae]